MFILTYHAIVFILGDDLYLPLGCGPHPLWLSCYGSESAIAAAKIQAKILSGRYRDDYLVSKFKNTDGSCTNCGAYPGDVTHYLSGSCPVLSRQLNSTLNYSLDILSEFPLLKETTLAALTRSPEDWTSYLLDPYSSDLVIPIRQEYGSQAVWPLFKLSRAMIWCMHRERTKILNCQS